MSENIDNVYTVKDIYHIYLKITMFDWSSVGR